MGRLSSQSSKLETTLPKIDETFQGVLSTTDSSVVISNPIATATISDTDCTYAHSSNTYVTLELPADLYLLFCQVL